MLPVMHDSYDDFSSSVSFSKIPHRFGQFTQRVTSVDDRRHFAGFKKLRQQNQVVFVVWFPLPDSHFLAPDLGNQRSQEQRWKITAVEPPTGT